MEKMYYEGKEYELTPKTMQVARQIEKTEKSATVLEAYRNEYDTIKLCVGEEVTEELLGSNLEEIDLNEMVKVYNAIIDGYDAPLAHIRHERERELLDSPSLKAIEKMARDIKALQELDATKQFVMKK